jgi:hypothetical protein
MGSFGSEATGHRTTPLSHARGGQRRSVDNGISQPFWPRLAGVTASVWTLAASAGISALLVASEPAFLTVKYLGAAYLLYLGIHAIWSAVRREPVLPAAVLALLGLVFWATDQP